MQKRSVGFTIVELLIVIVVIAILAAITIVAYNGIQNRANDNSVRADLVSFAKIIEMQKVDSPTGTYPANLTQSMGIKISRESYGQDVQGRNARYCYNSSTDSYVLLSNSKSGNYFKLLNGVLSTNAATYGYGVCSIVGLSNTNPVESNNGFHVGSTPQWRDWVN